MQGFLEGRVAQLEARLRESKLDFEQIAARLPEDSQARAAAIATVLGIDAFQVLRDGVTLEQLEQEREARRQATEGVERESEAAGIPQPGSGEEG